MNGQEKQSARSFAPAQVSAGKPAGKQADGHFKDSLGSSVEIRNVWADNLEEEMENIRSVLQDYPYVAMVRAFPAAKRPFRRFLTAVEWQDTEFPGVVARPVGDYTTATDYQYQVPRV